MNQVFLKFLYDRTPYCVQVFLFVYDRTPYCVQAFCLFLIIITPMSCLLGFISLQFDVNFCSNVSNINQIYKAPRKIL